MGINRRRLRRRLGLGFLLLLTLVLALLAWPREDAALKHIGIKEPLKIRRGLDLQGGVYLVYEADLSQAKDVEPTEVVKNAAAVIERRVNPGGTAESTIRTAAGNRIVIELPGVADPEQAKALIGKTAQLSFFEVQRNNKGKPKLVPTDVSGQDVQRATVDFQQTGGTPVVNLELKGGGSTDKFAKLTSRLSQSGQQLVTLLDQQVVFGPANVQQPITDGRAVLSGGFDAKTAHEIATLLNAGALPVPINLVAQQTVGPTLGAESIKQSVVAGVIGLLSVCVFLLFYYRVAGVISIFTLLFYSLLMVALFKLSVYTSYSLVLTLAGIAGFILSVAVAVDTNILVFERVKEELKHGSDPLRGFEDGFKHAWSSIRDANAATLIGCFILYQFGTSTIRGFALTLGLGVLLNLLTAQTATKLVMRNLVRSRFVHSPHWIGKLKGAK